MIRRLHMKFVLMNMVFVTLLLSVVFVVVIQTTRTSLARDTMQAMEQAAIEPLGPGHPGRQERTIPCFTLRLGLRGELIAAGDGYYDLSDEVWLEALLQEALKQGVEDGVLPDYNLRFRRTGPPERPTLSFADMSAEERTMASLIRTCLLAGSIAFLGFLAISVLLSRWAVRPVERAWEQQRQFVADASHELKTPLTVILTNAELLRGGPAGDADRFAGNILSTARRMRSLVESLLELARVEAAPAEAAMEDVDLSELVREALLPFEPAFFEQGLTLESEIEDGVRVRGVESQLRQVPEILLDNARKYAAPGGAVTAALRRSGRNCIFSVSNPGEPLTDQEREDVFKRFYRSDPARSREGGYGLGLAIARSIVARHGGKIWAESGEGGNTFLVRLPLDGKRTISPFTDHAGLWHNITSK